MHTTESTQFCCIRAPLPSVQCWSTLPGWHTCCLLTILYRPLTTSGRWQQWMSLSTIVNIFSNLAQIYEHVTMEQQQIVPPLTVENLTIQGCDNTYQTTWILKGHNYKKRYKTYFRFCVAASVCHDGGLTEVVARGTSHHISLHIAAPWEHNYKLNVGMQTKIKQEVILNSTENSSLQNSWLYKLW